jgi:hypothetical protein
MIEDRKLRLAMALVEGRLHKAVGGKRCGCGPCAHWVAVAARQAGVPREQLAAVLPPAARLEPRRSRSPRSMQARICDSATISVRGGDVTAQEGMAILLTRLHDLR